MANLNDADELWRQISPEEKLTLLNRSHSSGIFASLGLILIGAAFAVGLQEVWLFWGSFIVAPLVFQFSAGRTWRSLKPAIMLEFLAAKSAARRFAFTANAKDLTLQLLFRGKMEEVVMPDADEAQLEQTIANNNEIAVWIALFKDGVVLMEERSGGAQAHFAQPITSKFELEVENGPDGDYGSDKALILGYTHKVFGSRKVKVRSEFPGALVVFEKLLGRRVAEAKSLDMGLGLPGAKPSDSDESEME